VVLASLPVDPHHKLVILVILLVTYSGIALGHVPGLKLDRTGISLLGAIGMMIFGGVSTAEAVSYVSWSQTEPVDRTVSRDQGSSPAITNDAARRASLSFPGRNRRASVPEGS
jgi:hypothetical protein